MFPTPGQTESFQSDWKKFLEVGRVNAFETVLDFQN